LLLADPLLDRIKQASAIDIVVDERIRETRITSEMLRRPLPIQIPVGLGRHTWKLGIK
jgi:hypothetical protein